jgi:hypothetical protein
MIEQLTVTAFSKGQVGMLTLTHRLEESRPLLPLLCIHRPMASCPGENLMKDKQLLLPNDSALVFKKRTEEKWLGFSTWALGRSKSCTGAGRWWMQAGGRGMKPHC